MITFPVNDRRSKYFTIKNTNKKMYFEIQTAGIRNNRTQKEIQDQDLKREFGCFISPRKIATFMRISIEQNPQIRYHFLKQLYGVRERERLLTILNEVVDLSRGDLEKLSLLFSFLKLYTKEFEVQLNGIINKNKDLV